MLDDIADRVEIQRIRDVQVLLPASEASESNVAPKNLSTRFVRTWREKVIDNKHSWLRRSRLVAREYAWLSERTDLFSPASNAFQQKPPSSQISSSQISRVGPLFHAFYVLNNAFK